MKWYNSTNFHLTLNICKNQGSMFISINDNFVEMRHFLDIHVFDRTLGNITVPTFKA